MYRLCPRGGSCEYVADGVSHWATCGYAEKPFTTITGRVAGCGESTATIEVYQCSHFGEPVIKRGHPPCLDTLREQVPGATGRTCRDCREYGEPLP